MFDISPPILQPPPPLPYPRDASPGLHPLLAAALLHGFLGGGRHPSAGFGLPPSGGVGGIGPVAMDGGAFFPQPVLPRPVPPTPFGGFGGLLGGGHAFPQPYTPPVASGPPSTIHEVLNRHLRRRGPIGY